MAKKITGVIPTAKLERPGNLEDHIFYGLTLDEEQKVFRDAIWNDEVQFVGVNGKAGCGKTLIALATAILLVKHGVYDRIIYCVSPYGYERVGLLPGDLTQKTEVFFEPLYQALITCNEIPERAIATDALVNQKYDDGNSGFITAMTHTFTRGSNWEKTITILDEAQNFTEADLRKSLTRVCEGSKVVVIGHSGQIDLPNPNASGFERCLKHFENKNDPRAKICTLSKNYRSWVADTADEHW